MLGEPGGAAAASGGPHPREKRRQARLDYANSNRAISVELGGTSVAILAFILFFLYSGSLTGQFDPVLLRLTLGVVVASLFLFSYSAIYYYSLIAALSRDDDRASVHLRWADGFFQAGLVLLTGAPVLVLFTARLLEVGVFALVLWFGFLALLLRGWKARSP